MKTKERELARRMRREEGRSIREIARHVGVSVAPVSHWVRDIELTPEHHEALRRRNPAHGRQLSGRLVWAAQCRQRRSSWQTEGREAARRS